MRTLFALVLLAAVAAPLRADEQIPVALLNDIKAATVFVTVRAGRLDASGSGFVMQVDGDQALIVTNEHVINPPVPPRLKLPAPVIAVVLHSGRKNEKTVPAEVLSADAERDLAVLRVKDVKDLPKPLNLAEKVELVETMPVYIFGFPFGTALSTSKGNPAITVGKGGVSSIREDDRGEVKFVQIDGDLNPGNSGGPVVDTKGRLVGVAVARIGNSRIGMAIPPMELTRMLDGRLAGLSLGPVKVREGGAEVGVEMRFIDPLGKIEKASVRVIPSGNLKEPFQAGKDGKWPPLPDAQLFELKVEGQKATGHFRVHSGGKDSIQYTVQPAYIQGDKTLVYAQPAKPYTVSFIRVVVDPKPALTPNGTGLVVEKKSGELGELKVTSVSIGAGQGPACLCWSADAKAFYHLDGQGTVCRIRLADLKEEATLETAKKCGWLSVSAEGVILTVNETQEMWLLDAQSLKVARTARVGTAKRVISSPKLSFAYAAEIEVASARLNVIDLKTGEVARRYGHDAFIKTGVNFDNLVISPDGRLLFSTGGIEQVFRFKLDGPEVQFGEASARLIQGRFEGICVSADGAYVCAPSGGGNYHMGSGSVAPYATYIFSSASFASPALVLKQGPYPRAVGFDTKAGLIYGHTQSSPLTVWDSRGEKLKEYVPTGGPGGFGGVRQYLVHPEGRKLLVLGEAPAHGGTATVWYVELPSK